jgi:hypothetical protein
VLVDRLGKAPAGWLNASVGILVDPNVGFGGKKTGGVRLQMLGPAITPKPATKPATKPAPQPKTMPPPAAAEQPEEKGDPGFDPDLINSERDFEPVA